MFGCAPARFTIAIANIFLYKKQVLTSSCLYLYNEYIYAKYIKAILASGHFGRDIHPIFLAIPDGGFAPVPT
jgi:hypothetical protein